MFLVKIKNKCTNKTNRIRPCTFCPRTIEIVVSVNKLFFYVKHTTYSYFIFFFSFKIPTHSAWDSSKMNVFHLRSHCCCVFLSYATFDRTRNGMGVQPAAGNYLDKNTLLLHRSKSARCMDLSNPKPKIHSCHSSWVRDAFLSIRVLRFARPSLYPLYCYS